MERSELAAVFIAVLVLFLIAGFPAIVTGETVTLLQLFVISFVVIGVSVFAKKLAAHSLDLDVKHRVWHLYRYGVKPWMHFPREVPFGVILPVVFAFLGAIAGQAIMLMTFLSYEARALKHRAAKRFGHYSYAELTDWHNGLIGAAGVVALLVLSLVGYFFNVDALTKLAAYYAFWSIVPFGDLDGTHIYFGNRVLWIVLAVTSLIFALYASGL